MSKSRKVLEMKRRSEESRAPEWNSASTSGCSGYAQSVTSLHAAESRVVPFAARLEARAVQRRQNSGRRVRPASAWALNVRGCFFCLNRLKHVSHHQTFMTLGTLDDSNCQE